MARQETGTARGLVTAYVLLGIGFGIAVGTLIGTLTLGGDAPDTTVTRSEFTNRFGQDCTQVQTANAVAITCAYKPAESRLGAALEGLAQ